MPKALSRRELLAGLAGSIAAVVGTEVGGCTHTKIPCLSLGEVFHDKSAADVRSVSEPHSSWSLSFPSGRVK